MKQTTVLLVCTLSLILVLPFCKKGATHSAEHVQNMGPKSRVVDHDGLRFALDLLTAADHDRMASMMEVTMTGKGKPDYYVSLTTIDVGSQKMVRAEAVSMTITGPDGSPVSEPAHLMEGRGMVHHMVGFQKKKPGVYTVNMEAQVRGVSHKHTVSFDIK